jgi:hypothetical protein
MKKCGLVSRPSAHEKRRVRSDLASAGARLSSQYGATYEMIGSTQSVIDVRAIQLHDDAALLVCCTQAAPILRLEARVSPSV